MSTGCDGWHGTYRGFDTATERAQAVAELIGGRVFVRPVAAGSDRFTLCDARGNHAVESHAERTGYVLPVLAAVAAPGGILTVTDRFGYWSAAEHDCNAARWNHEVTDGPLGDAYTCSMCGQLMQVG